MVMCIGMFSKLLSGVATLLYASGLLTNGGIKEVAENVTASTSSIINSCDWYHVETGNDSNSQCDPFSMRHGMSAQSISTFRRRAEHCVVKYGVSCVLSHEVGMDTPGYFYSGVSGTELVMLPHLTKLKDTGWTKTITEVSGQSESVESGLVKVLLVDPDDPHASQGRTVLDLHERLNMNYLHAQSHSSVSRVIDGSEAFCAQLLARSVPEECGIFS